jgi:ribose transport system ATP-binding protein
VALELLRSLGLSPLDLDRPARLFSGGNQQKIVLTRWLLSEARVFLLDDPARGVDVGAREEMLRIFSRLAQEGRSLLFISSEPRELLAIAHRILVFREGRIVAVLPGERATEEALFHAAMAGSSPPSMGKEVS